MFSTKISVIDHNKVSRDASDKMNKFTHELNNWYPIGDRKFTIRFSETNYFDFFKSIGTEGFHVVYHVGDRIVGSACARFARNAWYLCDLKVHPDFRGRKITYKLLMKRFFWAWMKSGRGYAISMYPNEAVKKLNSGFKLMHMNNLGFVYIYLVTYREFMDLVYQKLKWYYNKHKYTGFLNINTNKKIIMDGQRDSLGDGLGDCIGGDSCEELKVLHYYHDNTMREGLIMPDETKYSKYKVFFCVLENDMGILNLSMSHYGMAILYARHMGIGEFMNLGTYEI